MTESLRSISQVDLESLRPPEGYMPSPRAWEDQVFYFLLLDRFSDDRENGYRDNAGNLVQSGTTPLYTSADWENAEKTEADARRWRDAGGRYVGGTLAGLKSKIGYLKRLGITAIWISPLLKQVRFQETYHGYGIQNFLEVEPHFGTREELREVVRVAHEHGILVILDIILNHAGNVFSYDADRYWMLVDGRRFVDPRWDSQLYRVQGFNDQNGQPTIPFVKADPLRSEAWPNENGAVWPIEFQDPAVFTRKGRINNWEYDPEFREGDFFDLKDISHGEGATDDYRVSTALKSLCKVYQYWVAYADLDGYRIDTVKHMDVGATRYFVSVMREFTQAIGKENFFLLGEITGGRKRAFETLQLTGLNAALGIEDIPGSLEEVAKGWRAPNDYFGLFRNSELINKESHTWFRDKVVTVFDDHDQVRKGNWKARFCADQGAEKAMLNVLALNALTLGIPCLYYGSEQCFDGEGDNDRFIREAMFGGEFGAFRSRGVHFFDESNRVYQELAKILKIRQELMPLRRGRQYLRPVSAAEDGVRFELPQVVGGQVRTLVAWSRIFNGQEIVVAMNPDREHPRSAWVTVDDELHQVGDRLRCIYSTDVGRVGEEVDVVGRNGKAGLLTVPAAVLVILR